MDWLDLLGEVGFSPLSYAHVVIAYLPNRDKNGREFDVEPWETAALKLQGRLFAGRLRTRAEAATAEATRPERSQTKG